ncbi:MAG: AraC family transcriptional regulator [Verrucomicrobiota bacterium]
MGNTTFHPEGFLASLAPGQLMESLWNQIPDAYFFVKDQESRFITANHDFAVNIGAGTVRNLIGKTDYDFSPDFLADQFTQDDRSVIDSGEALINKVELVPTADSLDWLSTTKIPLRTTAGEVIGVAGVTRITRDTDELYRDHPEMHRIVDFIRNHYRDKISVSDLTELTGASTSSVERLFRKTFGITPIKYIKKVRLNAACQALQKTTQSFSEIAQECGFCDQTSMTRDFRNELKITPRRYRLRFTHQPPTGIAKQKPSPQFVGA